ncbi:MAG: RNA polymerase sigma factor [Acidimicrobiia bacterium]
MLPHGSGYRLGVMVPSAPDQHSGWPPSPQEVVAAQNGDHGHLTVIMASGIPKLVAFYRGLGLRLHDAEDLASDTCEALVRSLPKLRDPARFEPWFWKVARSKFYDHLRRKQRSEPPTEREEMYDDPSDILVTADEHESVREAFLSLKMRDRELLWMRDVVGLAYADIAGRLFMREGAIRIAVMRARQRLEQALSEVEEGTQQS